MRTVLLLLLCLSLRVDAQNIKLSKPKVDTRVELLSIVFRLAGAKEYNSTDNAGYVEKIHNHFDRFKDHNLIKYAQQIRESDGIGYDAVMFYAINIDSLSTIQPIVPFSKGSPDKRWNEVTLTKFTALLKQFYKDADCKSFFDSNKDYYALAETQFYSLFKKLDVEWYYKYYGKVPNENFKIVIGLGNGGNNFGPHVDLPNKSRDVYAIIGASTFDAAGVPTFEDDYYLPTLIHEFNHSFVNYLIENSKAQLNHSAEIIFEKEKVKMKKQAYTNWETMINEATVRASVIRYMMNHESDTTKTDAELKRQLANGFVWMKELVALLGQFEKKRNSYPTLENFMPEIVSFYNSVAPNIDTYEAIYLKNCAKVVTAKPIENETIASTTTEIVFQFSKKLDGKRYFFGPGPKGLEHYPKPIEFNFLNDNTTIIMTVKLEPNTEYQINMIGRMMRTFDGYAVQDYVLNFKTRE
jgi:hypothetical protein